MKLPIGQEAAEIKVRVTTANAGESGAVPLREQQVSRISMPEGLISPGTSAVTVLALQHWPRIAQRLRRPAKCVSAWRQLGELFSSVADSRLLVHAGSQRTQADPRVAVHHSHGTSPGLTVFFQRTVL